MAITFAQANSARAYASDGSSGSKGAMDKNAFMQLLVAQLQNQDPLNPMSNKDSTAQMAQFASLEQLTNLNTSLQFVSRQLSMSQTTGASTLIGKTVLADGGDVSKKGDKTSRINLDLPRDMAKVSVNIHDEEGNIVRTVELGALKSGKHDFDWDGKDRDGNAAADGVYKISVVAENEDEKKFLVKTQVEGTVKAVVLENGKHVLELNDGRKVEYANVWKVFANSK